MIVYRLENKRNEGPFQWPFPSFHPNIIPHKEPACMIYAKTEKFSIQDYDGFLSVNDARFGWGDIYKMLSFVKFPASVDKTDFMVVIYDVPEDKTMTFSDGQVVFDIRAAEPVGGTNYGNLFQLCF